MALKAVGNAILNSPKAIRKKLGGEHLERVGHEILDEDWYHSEDPVKSGVSFFAKYLGSMGVTKTHGPGSTEDAVKAIVQEAKSRTHKLQKVKLTVSSVSIRLEDVSKQTKLDEIPLYRVSYCTVDPYYDKVFCYIARNGETKKLECHAFLCGKRSKAEAITLTVAQAFNIAFEKWQENKKKKKMDTTAAANSEQSVKTVPVSDGATPKESTSQNVDDLLGIPLVKPVASKQQRPVTPPFQHVPEPKIEIIPPTSPTRTLDSNPFRTAPTASPALPRRDIRDNGATATLDVQTTLSKAKSLDFLSIEDELDMEFQQLAEARSNPHLLDIGELNRSQVSGDVKQYMLGDRSYEDLSRSKSHDELMFL